MTAAKYQLGIILCNSIALGGKERGDIRLSSVGITDKYFIPRLLDRIGDQRHIDSGRVLYCAHQSLGCASLDIRRRARHYHRILNNINIVDCNRRSIGTVAQIQIAVVLIKLILKAIVQQLFDYVVKRILTSVFRHPHNAQRIAVTANKVVIIIIIADAFHYR